MRSSHRNDDIFGVSLNDDSFQNDHCAEKSVHGRIVSSNKVYIDAGSLNLHMLLGFDHESLQQAQIRAIKQPPITHQPWQPKAQQKLISKLKHFIGYNMPIHYMGDNGRLAFEKAIQLAQLYWLSRYEKQRKKFFCFANASFDGQIPLYPASKKQAIHDQAPLTYSILPYPYTWQNDPSIQTKESIALERIEKQLYEEHDHALGFIFEPLLQSYNGFYSARPQFLNKVVALVKKYGLPIITDERLLSPYRSGKKFSYQHLNMTPDIMILGTSMSSGSTPFGLTCASKEITAQLDFLPIEYQNLKQPVVQITPMIAETVLATLSCLEDRTLLESHLPSLINHQKKWAQILDRSPLISNVIHTGTMIAFETISQSPSHHNKVQQNMIDAFKKNGLLLGKHGKKIYLFPPLDHRYPLKDIEPIINHTLETIPLHQIDL